VTALRTSSARCWTTNWSHTSNGVTTLTSYGWTAESTKTGAIRC